jgi:hypothetical protein
MHSWKARLVPIISPEGSQVCKCPSWDQADAWGVLLIVLLLRFLKERYRLEFDCLNRLKIIQGSLRFLSTDLSVEMQAESVGAFGIDQVRLQGQEAPNDIGEPLHRRAENVDAS